MNINALLGTISFVLWSSFSVWFYVHNIYEFDSAKEYVTYSKTIDKEVVENTEKTKSIIENKEEVVVKEELKITETDATTTNNTSSTERRLSAINIEKEFTFYKNSDKVLDQAEFDQFVNSIATTIADRKVSIQIIGYTCDLGTVDFNKRLGLKRANAIAKALKTVKSKDSTLELESQGESAPKVPNDSEENRTQNRRVTILISSTL